jgi:hypothetical protein
VRLEMEVQDGGWINLEVGCLVSGLTKNKCMLSELQHVSAVTALNRRNA